jgi:uncharacterized membrane protein required for colicin V production
MQFKSNLIAVLLLMATAMFASPTARLQIIHNSPTPTVDVYVNNHLLLNDFKFRTATPYITVDAGVKLDIAIAPANSRSAADAIARFPVTLTEGKRYIAIAYGVVGNSQTPFNLAINDMGLERANSARNVGLSFFHGSPDAPAVDIRTGGSVVFGNTSFGKFTNPSNPYVFVPGKVTYLLDVTPAGQPNTVVASYQVYLGALRGRAAVVIATGFLSGGATPFEPWVVVSDGTTFPLRAAPSEANLQIIHNSPTPTVDIYVNDKLLLDNFEFRKATPFIKVPAGVELKIGVALGTSRSSADVIATFPVKLEKNKNYVAIASGIVGNRNTPFTIAVNDAGRISATNSENVDINFFHGSPDAPAVNILADGGVIFNNISFGKFGSYVSVPSNATYKIGVAASSAPSNIIASYLANVTTLKGKGIIVMATGFLGGTTPPFEPWVVVSDGRTFPLPLAPAPAPDEANLQIIHNSPTPTVDIYVNDKLLLDNFEFRKATPFIKVPAGVELKIGVALGTSRSSADVIATFPVKLEKNKNYVAIASGIVGNRSTPFTIAVNDAGRISATNSENVDINFFHGSPDAPAVNILANNNIAFNNISFGKFGNYVSVPYNAIYRIGVAANSAPNKIIADYFANVSTLKGKGIIIMATGFLAGVTPAFEPWVVVSDGRTFALPAANHLIEPRQEEFALKASTNSAKGLALSPNPAATRVNVNFSLDNESPVNIQILNLSGQVMSNTRLNSLNKGQQTFEINTTELSNGYYLVRLETSKGVENQKLIINK